MLPIRDGGLTSFLFCAMLPADLAVRHVCARISALFI